MMACASGQPFDHGLPISERWLDNLSGIYPIVNLDGEVIAAEDDAT
jgi:hypothetical protein